MYILMYNLQSTADSSTLITSQRLCISATVPGDQLLRTTHTHGYFLQVVTFIVKVSESFLRFGAKVVGIFILKQR